MGPAKIAGINGADLCHAPLGNKGRLRSPPSASSPSSPPSPPSPPHPRSMLVDSSLAQHPTLPFPACPQSLTCSTATTCAPCSSLPPPLSFRSSPQFIVLSSSLISLTSPSLSPPARRSPTCSTTSTCVPCSSLHPRHPPRRSQFPPTASLTSPHPLCPPDYSSPTCSTASTCAPCSSPPPTALPSTSWSLTLPSSSRMSWHTAGPLALFTCWASRLEDCLPWP